MSKKGWGEKKRKKRNVSEVFSVEKSQEYELEPKMKI